MNRHRFLETFGSRFSHAPVDSVMQEALEKSRSEGYEAGYSSGWDDAIASDRTARTRLEAEFERNIQNLAFTYGEAVSHVRTELRDFLTVLLDEFLPSLAQDALREHVRDELLQKGDALLDVPIEIVAATDCQQLIGDMLRADFSLEVNVVEDPSLAAGQVFVRLEKREMAIDLTSLMRSVSAQLKACTQTVQKKE